ncbi:MAG: T9SS type A sorting domain-containing protein [Candidatus Cloacimonetes bacterium]|nr:T9SS type A sorting domain-containing protein [Candidatus Cloacimonadota bacterium]MCF7868660.1 T9SS type A sorting domain-containing protein [Candidatus Cloacimonadota bacterium]
MRKVLQFLLLIISFDLFSATVFYYHNNMQYPSINYTINNQTYIEDQDIARWRSDETLYIDWYIEGYDPWWDDSNTNPDLFTEDDIEDILWNSTYSWYIALPWSSTYLEDFEFGDHDYSWYCHGDAYFEFVYDNSVAQTYHLYPTGNYGAGTAIYTSTSRTERSLTSAFVVASAHSDWFDDFFWKKYQSSTYPNLQGSALSTAITHEMGHVLGIGHISGETARMNEDAGAEVYCTTDITSWDEEACWELYNINPNNAENNTVNSNENHLSFNHPNPFNPSTTISYSLSENIQNPSIEIYNTRGQKVKKIVLEETPGENSVVWKGKDENNKQVSSGVYFYRLINEGKTVRTRKMLLMK